MSYTAPYIDSSGLHIPTYSDILDDLIATAGTVKAAGNLIEKLGGIVVECGFIVELPELKGRSKIKWPIYTITEFEGE